MQTFSRLDNTLKAYNIHLYIHTATLITIVYILTNVILAAITMSV